MQMQAENFVNIAAHLPVRARSMPHQQGVVFPQARDGIGRVAYTHLTFSQLERNSNILASGLEQFKVYRGVRVALMVKPCLEFFSLTFALFKIGAIPVFIDPGMGVKNLKKCLNEAMPEVFIGIPKAHVARILLRWPRVKQLITVGKPKPWVDLLQGDITSIYDPEFITGEYTNLKEFHQDRESQGQEIIQNNIETLRDLITLIKDEGLKPEA